MPRLSAFPYYGGKFTLSKWIEPLLPACEHYIEPFCGGAYVFLNREPSKLETINDLNSDVTNFFYVLRNQGNQLIETLKLTPYGREELQNAWHPTSDPIERARRFFVKSRQSFSGKLLPKIGWRYARYAAATTSIAWVRKIDQLPEIIDRLAGVQIENRPAIKVIQTLDHKEALFYCDPPYVKSSRTVLNAYGDYEMSDSEHIELIKTLKSCVGKVALSGYRCELYDNLLSDWIRHDKTTLTTAAANAKPAKRTESLWCNYPALTRAG